jgi:4-amino-4-deoxy-L-arabinose transferase-like glycosyltransferase
VLEAGLLPRACSAFRNSIAPLLRAGRAGCSSFAIRVVMCFRRARDSDAKQMISSRIETGSAQSPESSARRLSKRRGAFFELPPIEIGLGSVFFLVLLCLRGFYVANQPWDSDEPQHLHVVWAWANGLLPYKDVFDNHAPLFQAMSAPLFSLLGERADIVAAMRWAMLPIAALLLVTTYWIGARLFSVRTGFWGALLAASFPPLYFKLGEYRPDVFWAALWLIALAILIDGNLTPKRLFAAGFVFGVLFAVSMKSTFLLFDLLLAGTAAWLLPFGKGKAKLSDATSFSYIVACVLASIGGALIVPILWVGFFAFKGALPQMYYCLITHNVTSVENPWQFMMAKINDIRFWLFVPAIAGGLLLANRDDVPQRAARKVFFVATIGFYCPLLFTFWPLISKQDYLPFYPILMTMIGFLLVGVGIWIRERTHLPVYLLPVLVVSWQVVSIVRAHSPLERANQKNERIIADTLKLTRPGETVLDAKGQVIYRARPYYYVLEQLTREKAERGEIKDDTPARLIENRTPVVVESHWLTPETEEFINQNYVSVGSVMVLGKKVALDNVRHVQFEIVIPEKYRIVAGEGEASGTLDGSPINGERDLSAGMHDLVLDHPADAAMVVWARGIAKGYSPFSQANNKK